jgi:hypothetical protein
MAAVSLPVEECATREDWRIDLMANERPEAAYAARLLERQDGLQAEANRLVELLDLPTMLGGAGRFERLGSSVSGLMVWRDLDLGVSCGRLSPERAWETVVPLAAHPRTSRLCYRNEVGWLAPAELRGYGRYYFVAHHETDAGDEWKIDISLWSPESPAGPLAHAEELRGRLTPETRLAILWIKDTWHRLPSYPDRVSGIDIYEAVLKHGVRTPEQFEGYLRQRGLPTPP